MKKLYPVILLFIVWRILLCVPFLFSPLLPYRTGSAFTNIWSVTKPYPPVSSPLLYPWANFDGVHYLAIAGQGYADNERFMPLYPLLIKAVSLPFGTPPSFSAVYFFGALILSNLLFLGALIGLYRLLRLDYSRRISFLALVLLSVFPTSFFFGSVYSESLFIAACVASLYSARRKRWAWSGMFGLLASATRIVGILLLPALIWEWLREKKGKRSVRDALFLLLAPAGTLLYALYNWMRWGNPLLFLQAHGQLANGRATTSLVFPLQTLYRYLKIFLTVSPHVFEFWIALLEVCTFLFGSVMIYAAWRRKIRISYQIMALGFFLVPVFSGTFTGLPRYTAPLFPFFLALAASRNKIAVAIYSVIAVVLSVFLLVLFSRGYYIA